MDSQSPETFDVGAGAQAYALPRDPGRRFAERNAGWILSICLHIMLFCWLYMNSDPWTGPVSTGSFRVVLAEPTPEPVIDVSLAATPEPSAATSIAPAEPSPAVATRAADAPAEPDAPSDPGAFAIQPETVPTPAPSPEPTPQPQATPAPEPAPGPAALPPGPAPAGLELGVFAAEPEAEPSSPELSAESTDALASRIREAAEDIAAARAGGDPEGARILEETGGGTGAVPSSAVAQRLSLARADQAAQKTLYSSMGAREGAIREIQINDIDPAIAQRVMARYGMRILYTNINNSERKAGFLNSARTEKGQFISGNGKGKYWVFRYGPAATAKMAALEEDAMRQAGHTGETARIVRIVFGIVSRPDGYDLGVKQIELAPLAPAPGAGAADGAEDEGPAPVIPEREVFPQF